MSERKPIDWNAVEDRLLDLPIMIILPTALLVFAACVMSVIAAVAVVAWLWTWHTLAGVAAAAALVWFGPARLMRYVYHYITRGD